MIQDLYRKVQMSSGYTAMLESKEMLQVWWNCIKKPLEPYWKGCYSPGYENSSIKKNNNLSWLKILYIWKKQILKFIVIFKKDKSIKSNLSSFMTAIKSITDLKTGNYRKEVIFRTFPISIHGNQGLWVKQEISSL